LKIELDSPDKPGGPIKKANPTINRPAHNASENTSNTFAEARQVAVRGPEVPPVVEP